MVVSRVLGIVLLVAVGCANPAGSGGTSGSGASSGNGGTGGMGGIGGVGGATVLPNLAPDLAPCEPGTGTDYEVGEGGGQIASLDLVPWESLGPGDTVRIHHRTDPYRGKLL